MAGCDGGQSEERAAGTRAGEMMPCFTCDTAAIYTVTFTVAEDEIRNILSFFIQCFR